jgi:hypothetical protein
VKACRGRLSDATFSLDESITIDLPIDGRRRTDID